MKKFCFTLYLSSLVMIAVAQDSLYLVNTLTGTTVNRLYTAYGLGDINNDGFSDFITVFKDSSRIYLGNPDFELEVDMTVYGAVSPGDINNDGIDDFFYKKTERDDSFLY